MAKKQESLVNSFLFRDAKNIVDIAVQQGKEINDETTSLKDFKLIKLNAIKKNPCQPRKQFKKKPIEELAKSIAEQGLIQPIIVRPINDNCYEIIAGERRVEAHKLLKLRSIKASIKIVESDRDMLELALVENIQREDLSAIEIAETYGRLKREFGLNSKEISKKAGKDLHTVNKHLQIYAASPEIIEAAIKHNYEFTIIIELIKIKNLLGAEKFSKFANRKLDSNVSLRQLSDIVKKIKTSTLKKEPTSKQIKTQKFYTENKKSIKFSLNVSRDDISNIDKKKVKQDITDLLQSLGFKAILIN